MHKTAEHRRCDFRLWPACWRAARWPPWPETASLAWCTTLELRPRPTQTREPTGAATLRAAPDRSSPGGGRVRPPGVRVAGRVSSRSLPPVGGCRDPRRVGVSSGVSRPRGVRSRTWLRSRVKSSVKVPRAARLDRLSQCRASRELGRVRDGDRAKEIVSQL